MCIKLPGFSTCSTAARLADGTPWGVARGPGRTQSRFVFVQFRLALVILLDRPNDRHGLPGCLSSASAPVRVIGAHFSRVPGRVVFQTRDSRSSSCSTIVPSSLVFVSSYRRLSTRARDLFFPLFFSRGSSLPAAADPIYNIDSKHTHSHSWARNGNE